jgi:hypothetical protein
MIPKVISTTTNIFAMMCLTDASQTAWITECSRKKRRQSKDETDKEEEFMEERTMIELAQQFDMQANENRREGERHSEDVGQVEAEQKEEAIEPE